MISFVLFNLWLIIIIYSIYKYMFFRPKNFPPGPPKIPWFGSYIFMLLLNRNHLHKAVNKLCELYSTNILGMHLGNCPMVILNDSEKVKKALNKCEFDGKPDLLVARLREPNLNLLGIFFTEGPLWHEQRRFALRYMRDFGFGRRFDLLEKEIEGELLQFIDLLKSGTKYSYEEKYVKDGKILLPGGFGPVFGNCFLEVLFNDHLPRDKMGVLYEAVESAMTFQRSTDDYGRLYSIIPPVAEWFPEKSKFNMARTASNKLYSIYKKFIDNEIETFEENHERHFVDMYVNKMRELKADSEEKSFFSYEQLILTCVDFSFPSLSALSTTITFLIQQICIEPDIQTKIQDEIDNVVGQGRMPTLDDRINLPYTEACLREIMRYETLVPSGLPHKALQDTEFLGYNIPKGTIIITALSSSSHDNSVWASPEKFQPERFLDLTGKLSLKKDISLPFGAGKRLCAGETFARNMLFLFASAFFQSFSVSLPAGEKIHKFSDNLTGLIRTPPDHWIQLHAR